MMSINSSAAVAYSKTQPRLLSTQHCIPQTKQKYRPLGAC